MITITENLREAIRLYGVYTAWQFTDFHLLGSAKASCRAHIMSALAGKRVPQSKSGINAMREALWPLMGVTGDCLAAREDDFIIRARGILNTPKVGGQ